MKKLILGGVAVALLLTGGVFAYRAGVARADCPGKIICPITGKEICADKCPLGAKQEVEKANCCEKAAKP